MIVQQINAYKWYGITLNLSRTMLHCWSAIRLLKCGLGVLGCLAVSQYDGLFIRLHVDETWNNFDKFQDGPSSMKIFTNNLNGPLSPVESWPSAERDGRDTECTAIW